MLYINLLKINLLTKKKIKLHLAPISTTSLVKSYIIKEV
jgi:hypothetical protein